MIEVTLKGLWAHKRRLVSTLLAVALGVSFLAGTLVLGDTMRATFSDLFGNANAGTDAVVQPKPLDPSGFNRDSGAVLDESLVATVARVDGVAQAEPMVGGLGQIIGKDGTPVGGSGPPALAGNWVSDPVLNPYRLADGRLPQTDDEVVINKAAATSGHLAVGDHTTILTPEPVPVTVVGITTFGDLDSAGGATFTAFTTTGAQAHLLHMPGKISAIDIAARPGVSQEELVSRLTPVLPAGVQAITGKQLTANETQAINQGFLDVFSTFLLVFAGIALVVAAFSISNTFSIIVAQRTRESALLRALGATRRQVLGSTMAETAVVGVVASVVGVFGGLGIAALLKGAFVAFGIDIPARGLTLTGRTIAVSVTTGIVVTLLAGLMPALRSSRIPPIAALRDVAFERTSPSAARLVAGALAAVAGAGMVLSAAVGWGGALPLRAAIGSVLLLVGVVVLGPAVAGIASRVIGSPLAWMRGSSGRLARENAARNPRRTSSTAAALMVGVGVVTLFTVFAASLTASVRDSVARSFGGDLVVSSSSTNGPGGGFSPQLASQVAALPDVQAATSIGRGAVKLPDGVDKVAVIDPPQFATVLELGSTTGSLAGLRTDQLAVSKPWADGRQLKLGSPVPATFADGTQQTFTIGAVYDDPSIMGDLLLPVAAWTPHAVQSQDDAVLIKDRPGVDLASAKAQVQAITKQYPGTAVRTSAEYTDAVAGSVSQVLALIYVMLALAILIALMGIANTLALSIHERTRELGLLRAVGQTRRQVRAMVRGESVLIALFGTAGGIGVGVFLGWALVRASAGDGLGSFSAAPGPLVAIVLAGALAGVLAAIRPARRASRLDVLSAIAAG
jgi:putative ABC transport system permease protein